MSTDKVVPIRDVGRTAHKLIEGLSEAERDLPLDDLLPGYRLAPESRAELGRMVLLLQESRQLLTQAIERENPRFEAYSNQLEAREL